MKNLAIIFIAANIVGMIILPGTISDMELHVENSEISNFQNTEDLYYESETTTENNLLASKIENEHK